MNLYFSQHFRFLLLCAALALLAGNAQAGTIRGTVTDPLGTAVSHAKVELLAGNKVIADTTTDASGNYTFESKQSGRFRVRASAATFAVTSNDSFYSGHHDSATQNILLQPANITQELVVSATGVPTSEAQVGSSVTALTTQSYLDRLDVLDPLQSIEGLQVTQVGSRGGSTSLFIRGGDDDANKVLLDGVPLNNIGGEVEFGDLSSTSIDKVEVFRGPDSVLYGADALAGVVNLTSRHGTTPLPEVTYSADGGTFDTLRQEGTIGGAWRQFDYFTSFSHFDTDNDLPNDTFHSATLAGNFGWTPAPGNNLRLTFRRIDTALGLPNAIDLYGIPDDADQQDRDTFISATFDQQTTSKWHNLLRYGATRLDSKFNDPTPEGLPDGFGNYLGLPLTITGANGYSVTGQALYYSAGCCPENTVSTANRDFVEAQTDYQLFSHLAGLFDYTYDAERGFLYSNSPFGVTNNTADRRNMSFAMELRGDLRNRLFYSVGSGIDKDDIFGVETTPHISLAYYPFHPTSNAWKNTKLKFSFGKGIKEPSIFDQDSSLLGLLQSAGLPQLIQQYNVQPVGAERSRSYDFGVDQAITNRAVLKVTLFHDQFTNGAEFVGTNELITLGVPLDIAAQANGFGGATVNTFRFRTEGLENGLEYKVTNALFARAGYTYLDARVQNSFSDGALSPAINPAFPNIPIGAYAPLIGARPFRRAPHTGYLGITYNQQRWSALLQSTFVGSRDDSTFLLDDNYGDSLLLPNHNLDAAYQKLDLSGDFHINQHLSLYASLENLLNEHYQAAFGYPSLPFTIRSGLKITLGGESWRWK